MGSPIWSDIIAMEYPSPHILCLYSHGPKLCSLNLLFYCRIPAGGKHSMFTAFFFHKRAIYRRRLCRDGWQLCRTMGPLTLHSQEISRFLDRAIRCTTSFNLWKLGYLACVLFLVPSFPWLRTWD